jgi:hypothetical protein
MQLRSDSQNLSRQGVPRCLHQVWVQGGGGGSGSPQESVAGKPAELRSASQNLWAEGSSANLPAELRGAPPQGQVSGMPPHIAALVRHVRQVCAEQRFDYRLWSEGDLYASMEAIDARLPRVYDSAPSYAAKSDILRLVALYLHGGVYIDTDCLILQPGQLEWLIAGSPELVLLNFASPYEDSIAGYQLFGETNNCFLAAPARSPSLLRLLRAVARKPPFDPQRHRRFSWTMQTAGPGMYLDFIRGLPATRNVRFLPRAVVMGEFVDNVAAGVDAMLVRYRGEFPSAVLLHAEFSLSGESWLPGSIAAAAKLVQRISKHASRHATVLQLLVIGLTAVVVGSAIRGTVGRVAARGGSAKRRRDTFAKQ